MRALVIGAGPAGLAFAIECAQGGGGHDLTVVERRGPEQSPGWGVTLRDHAFASVGLGDLQRGAKLEGRALWYRGTRVVDLPNPAAGYLVTMARSTFLAALRARCVELGVKFRWHTTAEQVLGEVDDYDLVVGADGARSAVRRRFAEHFKPTTTLGDNYFVWLGTPHLFHKLSILVRDEAPGLLGWGYRYSDQMSTLIVECSEATFQAADLGSLSRDETSRVISQAFEAELSGQPVYADAGFHWARHPTLRCQHLAHRHVVLLGDAAHTTHYSQGFGTLAAIEDARALHEALAAHPRLDDGLAAFDAERHPKVAQYQATASLSRRWAESMTAAADARHADAVRALIAARWPDNVVHAGPLDAGAQG